MEMKTGLLIPIHILEYASGIQKNIIKKDINNSQLRVRSEGFIWYQDALNYVFAKWNEGKTDMYPPYSDDPNHSFAARVLSMIDDEIAVNNVRMEWKEKS